MFWTVTLSLLEGFGKTLEIFGLTLLFSIPLGLIIAFGSMSKFAPIKWLSKTLVWIIRGTPLMLQLIVVFYGPGLIAAGASELNSANPIIQWISTWEGFDRFTAVIVAFIINYSCYFSE
ncbi:MAG: ABC transporter permease subunit, partial [Clostridia bacterium]|nr:ABC transporter permease subunit [Clostridia bacterium]